MLSWIKSLFFGPAPSLGMIVLDLQHDLADLAFKFHQACSDGETDVFQLNQRCSAIYDKIVAVQKSLNSVEQDATKRVTVVWSAVANVAVNTEHNRLAINELQSLAAILMRQADASTSEIPLLADAVTQLDLAIEQVQVNCDAKIEAAINKFNSWTDGVEDDVDTWRDSVQGWERSRDQLFAQMSDRLAAIEDELRAAKKVKVPTKRSLVAGKLRPTKKTGGKL